MSDKTGVWGLGSRVVECMVLGEGCRVWDVGLGDRAGLAFKAHRLFNRSALGSRGRKKKNKVGG